MNLYAIADLHLHFNHPEKTMSSFGPHWSDHATKIKTNWHNKITDDDLVILPGDLSWGMRLEEIDTDMAFIDSLPGKKLLLKGNHDYWWSTLNKIKTYFLEHHFDFTLVQQTVHRFGDLLITGVRGWDYSGDIDDKQYRRALLRLELAIEALNKVKKAGDRTLLMLHYPPFSGEYPETPLLTEILNYQFDFVVFGHIHGIKSADFYNRTIGDTQFFLVSSDMIDFDPVLITEV